jgi:CRP-like cAMP-binding protein
MTEPTELHPGHAMLLRKLRSISPLTEDETHCLLALPLSIKSVGPDQDIVREGDRPSECCLVVEGEVIRIFERMEEERQRKAGESGSPPV